MAREQCSTALFLKRIHLSQVVGIDHDTRLTSSWLGVLYPPRQRHGTLARRHLAPSSAGNVDWSATQCQPRGVVEIEIVGPHALGVVGIFGTPRYPSRGRLAATGPADEQVPICARVSVLTVAEYDHQMVRNANQQKRVGLAHEALDVAPRCEVPLERLALHIEPGLRKHAAQILVAGLDLGLTQALESLQRREECRL